MVPNWNDVRVAEEHFNDMAREVERERYGAQVQALMRPAAPRPGLRARLLARVGRALVAWGSRLQALDPQAS
jgi:phage baseplate assembly protein W